jgi:hypothetical protein
MWTETPPTDSLVRENILHSINVDCEQKPSFLTGFAPLRETSPFTGGANFTVFLHMTYDIFGIAFDAHFKRRNLYW